MILVLVMKTSFFRWAGAFALCLFCNALFAQKENSYWTFPDSLGFYFTQDTIYIVSSTTIGYFDSQSSLAGRFEPFGSICNAIGELQFYFRPDNLVIQDFNGQIIECNQKKGKVVNREHLLMENGDSIFNGASTTNGALILPIPQKENEYYLFTLKYHPHYLINYANSYLTGLFAHKIDMSFNDGLGKVVEKNVQLHDYALGEKLCAVRHANGRDWWIFAHKLNSSEYVRWLLTSEGLSEPAYQAIGLPFANGDQGEMLFSPDGTRLAAAIPFNSCIEVLNFNRCTGLFESVFYTRCKPGSALEKWYGCAFSPTGRYLYVAQDSGLGIYQFDLEAANIDSSKVDLSSYLYTLPEYLGGGFGHLELGTDGKIYVGSGYGGWPPVYWNETNMNLSVINVPDSAGLGCDFQPFSFWLAGKRAFAGLPHFPNFGLGPLAILPADAGPDKFLCKVKNTTIGTPAVPGYSYQWKPSYALSDSTAAMPIAAPTTTTTYTLYVYGNGPDVCGAGTDTVTVYVNETALSPDFSVALDGFSATFESNVSDLQNYTLKWNFGTGDTSLLASPTYVFPDTGLYTVTLVVSDTSGCTESVSKVVHVKGPNQLSPSVQVSGIKVYPNPTRGVITVHCPQPEAAGIELFDATGRVVLRTTVLFPHTELDIAHLPAGIYTVKIGNSSTKFVKQE